MKEKEEFEANLASPPADNPLPDEASTLPGDGPVEPSLTPDDAAFSTLPGGEASASGAPPPPPAGKKPFGFKGKTPKEPAAKSGKGGYKGRRRRVGKDHIVRIEELEDALANDQSKIDPDAVVSMYMPRRRIRRFAAVLLRTSKMQFILLCMLLGVAALFILSFMQEKMGNFTINLNRLELYRRGISIADNAEFARPTARLVANTVADATNISIDDLPEDVNDLDGDHNGKNYMAYTYYVRNAGKVDVGYVARITLDAAAKGAQQAVRVAVWYNNNRIVYAAPASDGDDEPGCVSFMTDRVVCEYHDANFQVGDVDKYTIVVWMEGDDPECLDDIVGGSIQFGMNIDTDNDDNTNLLMKFVQDIIDTLTGDKPIDAAGTVAPDYYSTDELNWYNRRNQQDGITTTDSTTEAENLTEQQANEQAAAEQGQRASVTYSRSLWAVKEPPARTHTGSVTGKKGDDFVVAMDEGGSYTLNTGKTDASWLRIGDRVAFEYTADEGTTESITLKGNLWLLID